MSWHVNIKVKNKKAGKSDDMQLLGNNETYLPLEDEFKRQGINTSKESYSGKITEIQPIIEVLEQYILDIQKRFEGQRYKDGTRKSIYDLTPRKGDVFYTDITEYFKLHHENAYIFITVNLVNFLEKNEAIDMSYDSERDRYIYVLKKGVEITISAG